MTTFGDWKEGDLAVRKDSLCRIVRIHFDEYPPHVTVKMLEDGNEIGTEFSKLRHPLPSELETLEQTNLSDNTKSEHRIDNNNNNIVMGNTDSNVNMNDRLNTNGKTSRNSNKTSIKTDTTNNNAESDDNNSNNREDNDNESNNYSDDENDTNIKDAKTTGNRNTTKPVSKLSSSTSAPPPQKRPYEEHQPKTISIKSTPIPKTTTHTPTPITTKKKSTKR